MLLYPETYMARSNYSSEKRRKELEKKVKKEAKIQRKLGAQPADKTPAVDPPAAGAE